MYLKINGEDTKYYVSLMPCTTQHGKSALKIIGEFPETNKGFKYFNDDDEEITRFVIEQWIGNTDDDFYDQIASIIRKSIEANKENVEKMSILKPFSFVLEDEDKESLEELYLVDDEVVMIDPELMAGLDEDLNDFMEKLLRD